MRANNGLIRMAVLQALACASGLILATPGRASAAPAQFDITAQPLPSALKSFATQAKMRLLYQYDVVSHATANPVAGQLENHAALEKLLEGTGLQAVYNDPNTATIRPIPAPKNAGNVRLARADTNTDSDTGSGPEPSAPSGNSPELAAVSEVVVVGVRQALETAQDIKLNSPTFVD